MSSPQPPADQLLDELVGARQLITYKAAYAALLGAPPDPWYPSHGRQAARIAECSKAVTVGGLQIRLDALVVLDRSEEPSDPHFDNKPYTRAQWQSVFGGWDVRRP